MNTPGHPSRRGKAAWRHALLLGCLCAFSGAAMAEPAFHGDTRGGSTYGHAVSRLPSEHQVFNHGGVNYYYSHGWWYRGYGPHFVTIHPPFGLHVRFLPDGCRAVVVAGITYWVFNDVYYRPFGPDYVIVEPPVLESVPTEETVPSPPATAPQTVVGDVFAYPRNGQSEQQQAKDRYECHAWAVRQTGYDPTQPLGGVSQDISLSKRAEYQRAITACLEGRGYTVR